MASLRNLLGIGYFPKELPSPFGTVTLAALLTDSSINKPTAFTNGKRGAKMCCHNLARPGSLRRKLGIPNPVLHYNLCFDIESHWSDISTHIRKSTLSSSKPSVQVGSPRALASSIPKSHLPLERASIRSTSRFILKTDISRFYPSIYSHSVPWALHTKPVAKEHRKFSSTYYGNSIDRWVRNAQDGQTLGVPIGPDTSWVIAEIILAEVDAALMSNSRIRVNGFRHFDDYEFGCRSISEAENLLAMLQEQLSEYELDVNPKKTDIIKLPVPLESIWTSDLRNFRIRRTAASQRYDLIEYFGRAFEYYRGEPEDHVLRYAVSKLRDINIDPSNLDLYNDLLIQCMMVEAGCIRFVFEQFLRFQRASYSIAVVKLQEAFNDIISRNAPLGHGSEVAWALWGAILFDISIDDSVANTLSEMMDSVVALLALDAQNRGLINPTTSFTKWESVMTSDELYGEQWLLCYEANVKGWLPSLEGGDHVATDPNFGFLKANGVSFYDTGMVDVSRSSPARLSSRDDSIISGY